ncbi:deoxyribodipyrimidine photo-lyase [Halomonas elongata]|uniref:Deoxyribodipyrimidine photo-lyase n=1 Tax=Halomonas elongata TaxID=2746 RepID=A0A1B8P7I7_HALEL|nr:deoxyribodipyrimidine photo-lyase [Halomonas elongata]
MPPSLIWFRSDLRVHDNTALAAAASEGPVVAVFLRSTAQWLEHGHGANKLDFWHRGVLALRAALHGLGIPLLHRDIDDFAAAPDALLALARETGARRLHFNHEYPLNERRRDASVVDAFEAAGLSAVGHHDGVAFAPGELRTGKGDFYGIFTPFAKAWHRQVTPERLALRDLPAIQASLPVASDPEPELPALDTAPAAPENWPAGENAAADRLERFLRWRARHYTERRDFPAESGTSSLSPYLALGMISHRQCLQAALAENDGGLAEGDAGLTAWVNELIWRSSISTSWSAFPRYAVIAPSRHTPRHCRGATTPRHGKHGPRGVRVIHWSMLPCASYAPPAGCTIGCAWSRPCFSPSTCSSTGATVNASFCTIWWMANSPPTTAAGSGPLPPAPMPCPIFASSIPSPSRVASTPTGASSPSGYPNWPTCPPRSAMIHPRTTRGQTLSHADRRAPCRTRQSARSLQGAGPRKRPVRGMSRHPHTLKRGNRPARRAFDEREQ